MDRFDREIDINIDYYKELGLLPNASTENIKAAYFLLAPKYHPDTAGAKSESEKESNSKRFIEIFEAYTILSKPDSKNRYDYMRNQKLSKARFSVDVDTSNLPMAGMGSNIISDGYTTQKNHYQSYVRIMASSSAVRDKYKTERWQGMPLSKKKDLRRKGLQKMHGNSSKVLPAVMVMAVGLIAYTQYTLT